MVFEPAQSNSIQTYKNSIAVESKKIKVKNVPLYFFSGLIVLFFITSFVYLQKVYFNIDEKKKSIEKLQGVENSLNIQNEKIKMILSQIKNGIESDQKLIKIIGESQFQKESEMIKENFEKMNQEPQSRSSFYIILFGILFLVVLRLLYLEFSSESEWKRKKKNKAGFFGAVFQWVNHFKMQKR
ncbi:MAG TPA: hypothetical protein DHW82_05060 [Spirochaetia bacterium]|nr:MAG: hypothetical protein A2Y41_11760 [Spirochaetes bacterium GWB1_36_13]HCL56362.1 hypothetical protein [Spirochaetia bacterium]